ncbi:hypothetical protein ACH4SP_36475 [Streptomyces sp. NPDC021093]|uniref:hypothetical protein n=1 Tax=Streptomyces sp. NPDC021093 TaxID=3365112 RepID=UPI0037BB139D
MEPLTEHRPVNGPVVYGYLRLDRASDGRQQALSTALAQYCLRHELQLSGVFIDRADRTGRAAAFTGLLDVLALPDSYGVVIPAPSHLGPRAVAAAHRKRIEKTGSRLLLVRGAHRSPVLGHRK